MGVHICVRLFIEGMCTYECELFMEEVVCMCVALFIEIICDCS